MTQSFVEAVTFSLLFNLRLQLPPQIKLQRLRLRKLFISSIKYIQHPLHSWSYLTLSYYQPQRSCGQGNIFAPVCHSVHRGGVCLSACWDATPHKSRPLPEQTPPRADPQEQTPPKEQTSPKSRHPQEQTPSQSRHPPKSRHPPPRDRYPPKEKSRHPPPDSDSSIRSMSGQYASYWNAFLLTLVVRFAFSIIHLHNYP